MRLGPKVTMGVMALLLSGCEMNLRRAKTPPAPQPTTAAAEEPPPAPATSEPLSIPQTQVKLPRPQPIDPEALATPPSPPSEPSATHTPHKAKRTGPQPAAAPPVKSDPVETAETPAPATAETPRPSIEPVLPEEKRRQLQEDVASRLRDVDQKLTRLAALRLSQSDQASVERIRQFAKLSQDALYRGDLQMANSLAERALIAAQELLRDR